MSTVVAVALGTAAEKVFGTLIGELTKDVYDKLQGDPAKKAFAQALAAAVQRYADGGRLDLARPLLRKDGFLADADVAAELSHVLRFDRAPDLDLIGRKWRSWLDAPPTYRDFSEEAGALVNLLEAELRQSEVFRPAFEARDLRAIAAGTEAGATALETLSSQLEDLSLLLDNWAVAFGAATAAIQPELIDFRSYIEEKSRHFVGRKWIFDQIEGFLAANPCGYFFISGDPGIGKSALAAQLVKQHGHIHHFNIRLEGINKAENFLRNVCAQLITAYQLDHAYLPADAARDAGFLKRLLAEVSERLGPGERCIVVVDALDEVAHTVAADANPLYLPPTLPRGVYLICTMRPEAPSYLRYEPRVSCERGAVHIDVQSRDNLADVVDFLRAATARPGIQRYVQSQELAPEQFVATMVERSEGNFMYLRYVLADIEKGAYQSLAIDRLPAGLSGYYSDHWQRMGMAARPLPRAKIKIVYILSETVEPISRAMLALFADEDELTVQAALDEWAPFLHRQVIDNATRYSLYHTTFREFLNRQEIVQAAGISIDEINAMIVDALTQNGGA